MEDKRLLVTRKIFRFQGPLVIQPPSQGARELARNVCRLLWKDSWEEGEESHQIILDAITAAEQIASKAEKSRWVKACKVETDNRENNPIRVATALGIRMRAEGHAIDQPAQPAEPGNRVIFCDVCGPNPETILLPDKFGTMQVFCKACHKPTEQKTHVEAYLQDPEHKRQFDSEKERYFHDWLADLEQRVLRLEGKP